MAPEVTDSLALVPRQMYIRRIIRHKFVLKSNLQVADPDRKAFRIAALPPAPLHKCMADASLLADIVISKYVYHLPFYRVMETYKELGVSISASTINDWFKAVVGKVKPIYDLLRAHVLACDYVQVDESTLPVIDNERHRAVKGYVWSVVNVMTGDRFFFYEHGSSSTRVAMGLLKDFTGAIQSDGYIVYEHFEGMEGKKLLGGWAHARRKNYLFCGDDDDAQRAAVVYSLLATCKAHGVNERAWLEDVLRRIPEYEQAGKDYADLLPGNWRALSAK